MTQLLYSRKAYAILFIAIITAFWGCRENTLVNSKVSPSNNAVGVYDTALPCITHTYYDDTAETSTNLSGLPMYQAVGAITDPYFGTMTGATYFQVVPLDPDTSFFSINVVDSAFLVLPYSGFTYGDTTSSLTQTYQVFYLTDSLGYNTSYYSYQSKSIDATFPLSDPYPVDIRSLRDSLTTFQLARDYPGIHIPLKLNTLLRHLKPAQNTLASAGNTFNNFISEFNGVCVRVADTRNFTTAIPYFQLDGNTIYSQAGIVLYYHPIAGPDTAVVTSYYFNPTFCAHFNSITKSYSHFPVNNLFRSTQANDSVIALQNLPGAAIDVKIQGIKSLPAGIINKAELQFPLLPNSYPPAISYQTPIKLYPSGVGNGVYPNSIIQAGLTYVIADYYPISSTSPLAILDGYVHLMTTGLYNGHYVYTIDIPREVMSSIQAKNDVLHFQINGTQEYYGAFHMVGGGGSYPDSTYRPRLFVVYSKLNK